jgi:hypothetical protein
VGNILVRIEGILNLYALGCHWLIDDGRARLADNGLGALFGGLGVVTAGESVHKLAAIVSLEVDSSNISIIECRGTANATVILAVGAVKDTSTATCVSATATGSTECRALIRLSLLREGAEKVSG